MLRRKKLAASAALIAGLLISGHAVASDKQWFQDLELRYHDETSGTTVSTVVDTNGDGVTGGITTLKGRSSRGPVTITAFAEFNPFAAAPSANCPAGTLDFPMVESTLVYRFVGGDLLFLRVIDAAFCMDLATGVYEFRNSSIILGGTGRYAGATGTIDAKGQGSSMSFDPTGTKHFGWTTMKSGGKIQRHKGK